MTNGEKIDSYGLVPSRKFLEPARRRDRVGRCRPLAQNILGTQPAEECCVRKSHGNSAKRGLVHVVAMIVRKQHIVDMPNTIERRGNGDEAIDGKRFAEYRIGQHPDAIQPDIKRRVPKPDDSILVRRKETRRILDLSSSL